MAQRNREVFKRYSCKLAMSLPMDDSLFVANLAAHSLLPGDTKGQITSRSTQVEKATYFLDHVIKQSLDADSTGHFNNLLSIMKDSDYCYVDELASQILQDVSLEPSGNHKGYLE